MVIGQQELTPNILGDVGEALSGATADTGPKHKPHGPKGRLMGSQIALCVPGCSRVFRSTSQTSRRVGSSFPSLGAEQIPAGSEHLEGLLMQEGTAAALGGHPSPLPCSAPASHCVSLSPLGGGQWARGIFAGGKSWPERGRDGDAGGGSSHSHSSGGVGALGEGGGGGSLFQRVLGTMPSREAAVKPRQHRWNHTGRSRAARSGRATEAAAWGKPWRWGSWGLSPGRACFACASRCTPRTKVQRLPQH